MILTIDVGNTHTIIGAFCEGKLLFTSRISTDRHKTQDEYAVAIRSVLSLHGATDSIDGAIISSVVPQVSSLLENAIKMLFGCRVFVVGPGVKTGLNIKIDNPAQLGADLVCVSVAAQNKYPLPSIVFDLGTATTISALTEKGEMIGGSILTGVGTALNALAQGTAQLPQISLSGEVSVIGSNTVDCMRSGAIIGAAAMIDGMILRYKEILGENTTVIATGGLAGSIVPHCRESIVVDDNLLLDGLYSIYKKNI
ncbi:MAG: type III pantothenate kinase [Oscillospiraceae bacterium]|nr:type III pantothenate kinase [Oscillospiraceae bacterium]